MYAQKSGLRKVSEVIILVGAIFETIIHAMFTLLSFGLYGIVSIPVLILTWVTRHQAVNRRSRGWAIYGIIHGVSGGWFTSLGYILLVIDNNLSLRHPIYQDREQF